MKTATPVRGMDIGGVAGWRELDGSLRGGLSHGQALSNAGYVIS